MAIGSMGILASYPARRAPRACASLLAAALVMMMPACASAQDADGDLGTAETSLHAGRYEEARGLFRTLLGEALPEDERRRAAVGFAEAFLATGAYEEGLHALDPLLHEAPDDPYLLHVRGRLLAATGRLDAADAAFNAALQQAPAFWRNVLAYAELLRLRGQANRARDLYVAIYRQYDDRALRTAADMAVAARAAARLEQFRQANDAFRTAHDLDPTDVTVLTWWADLFREKYNDADAQRTYEDALAVNARCADAYAGLARTVGGFGQQEKFAQRALAVNPNHVAALSVQAGLRILDGQYGEGQSLVKKALDVNPTAEEALGHLGAIHLLQGDSTAYLVAEERALAVNPQTGDFYLAAIQDLEHRFRYPTALAVARKGVSVARSDVRVFAAMGVTLLRNGDPEQARRYLQAAFDHDPYNLFVGNTLTLLDGYADFDVQESPHFELLIHQDESQVLGPLILETAEAAYADLSSRYPYVPPGKVRLEAYDDAGDFAVRIAGIPHLSLLGVSFGDVVAFDTPHALTGEPYNWARTVWHELAHTMAIGTSAFHVPRWFTEGLSVWEEQHARPEWGRELDLELFAALDAGKLLPLPQIDRGFTRPSYPGQILLSYYHASKVIDYVVRQYGFDAITGILQALGDGVDVDAAFTQVVGRGLAVLDEDFRADLRQQRARLAKALEAVPTELNAEENAELLDKLTGPSENPFFQQLQAGRDALRDGRVDAAEKSFRDAMDIYPDYVGSGNAYDGLAAIYRTRGDTAALRQVLEDFLAISEYGAAEARELAALHEAAGDTLAAAHLLRRALDVDPYDLDSRAHLADLYEHAGQLDAAIRERRAVVALAPVDQADAYFHLARTLHRAGHTEQAKRAVLQCLEHAPGYREAQKLLLALVDGGA